MVDKVCVTQLILSFTKLMWNIKDIVLVLLANFNHVLRYFCIVKIYGNPKVPRMDLYAKFLENQQNVTVVLLLEIHVLKCEYLGPHLLPVLRFCLNGEELQERHRYDCY